MVPRSMGRSSSCNNNMYRLLRHRQHHRCRYFNYNNNHYSVPAQHRRDHGMFIKNYCCFFSTSSTAQFNANSSKRPSVGSSIKADPLAKRPNKICDPYGQGGKPLSWDEARKMMETTGLKQDNYWKLININDGELHENFDQDHHHNTPATTTLSHDPNATSTTNTTTTNVSTPWALTRQFYHVDYMHAARFITTVCAVAHNHNHYPHIHLERQLLTKQYLVTTTVTCHTTTLQGLSYHDFHIAMMLDVELQRPEVKMLLLDEDDPATIRRTVFTGVIQ